MKKIVFYVAALVGCVACSGGQGSLKTPVLLSGEILPKEYSSPDGYALGKDGNLYLSMNQKASNWTYPAKIMRITQDDKLELFCDLPLNPKTGKCAPLGLAFAEDGNLYVSDNQSFCTDELFQSGIIRVKLENGKPVGSELVVSGFNMSNGMTSRGRFLYVAETNLATADKFMSGVYRFSLDELKSGETLRVTGIGDPHLILTFETKDPDHQVGANGVSMDSKGRLYVCNFGDAEVMRYELDAQGGVVSGGLFCKATGLLSCDGLQIDADDNLWIADFRGNAVGMIDQNGNTTVVAKNSVPTTGEKGELDAPSECIRRGDKVYVSNIDIDYDLDKQSADPVQTISVIHLK